MLIYFQTYISQAIVLKPNQLSLYIHYIKVWNSHRMSNIKPVAHSVVFKHVDMRLLMMNHSVSWFCFMYWKLCIYIRCGYFNHSFNNNKFELIHSFIYKRYIWCQSTKLYKSCACELYMFIISWLSVFW